MEWEEVHYGRAKMSACLKAVKRYFVNYNWGINFPGTLSRFIFTVSVVIALPMASWAQNQIHETAERCAPVWWKGKITEGGPSLLAAVATSHRKILDPKGYYSNREFLVQIQETMDMGSRIRIESPSYFPCYDQSKWIIIAAGKIKIQGLVKAKGKNLVLVADEIEIPAEGKFSDLQSLTVFAERLKAPLLDKQIANKSLPFPARLTVGSNPWVHLEADSIVSKLRIFRSLAKSYMESVNLEDWQKAQKKISVFNSIFPNDSYLQILRAPLNLNQGISEDQGELLRLKRSIEDLEKQISQGRNRFGQPIRGLNTMPLVLSEGPRVFLQATHSLEQKLRMLSEERRQLLAQQSEKFFTHRQKEIEIRIYKNDLEKEELAVQELLKSKESYEYMVLGVMHDMNLLVKQQEVANVILGLIQDLKTKIPEPSQLLKDLQIVNAALGGGVSGGQAGSAVSKSSAGPAGAIIGAIVGGALGAVTTKLQQDYEKDLRDFNVHNAEIEKRLRTHQAELDVQRAATGLLKSMEELKRLGSLIEGVLKGIKRVQIEMENIKLRIIASEDLQEQLFTYLNPVENLDFEMASTEEELIQRLVLLEETFNLVSQLSRGKSLETRFCESLTLAPSRRVTSCLEELSGAYSRLFIEGDMALGANSNFYNFAGSDSVEEIIVYRDVDQNLHRKLKSEGKIEFRIGDLSDKDGLIQLPSVPFFIQSVQVAIVENNRKPSLIPVIFSRKEKEDMWMTPQGPLFAQVGQDQPLARLHLRALELPADVVGTHYSPLISEKSARSFFSNTGDTTRRFTNRSPLGTWTLEVIDPTHLEKLREDAAVRVMFFLRSMN